MFKAKLKLNEQTLLTVVVEGNGYGVKHHFQQFSFIPWWSVLMLNGIDAIHKITRLRII
jgi:hypothetical protein